MTPCLQYNYATTLSIFHVCRRLAIYICKNKHVQTIHYIVSCKERIKQLPKLCFIICGAIKMDSTATRIILGLMIPIYILFIVIPSFVLNGLIVISFIKVKEIRTPSNLLAVHISIVSLIVSFFCSPITISSFSLVMSMCDCSTTYYQWLFGHIFHFGLYPLNILLLTISYLLILKYSSAVLSFRRVLISILVIWMLAVFINLPAVFVTPQDSFVECCETVCRNGSDICNNTVYTFTPHTFTVGGRVFYNIRDVLLIMLPSILVFITSAASYYIYKKSIINSPVGLKLRMILLPVVMTLSVAFYIFGQDVINWRPTQVSNSNIPGIFIFIFVTLLWDSNGVFFACLILFFNVKLRRKVIDMVNFKKVFRQKEDANYNGSSHEGTSSSKITGTSNMEFLVE